MNRRAPNSKQFKILSNQSQLICSMNRWRINNFQNRTPTIFYDMFKTQKYFSNQNSFLPERNAKTLKYATRTWGASTPRAPSGTLTCPRANLRRSPRSSWCTPATAGGAAVRPRARCPTTSSRRPTSGPGTDSTPASPQRFSFTGSAATALTCGFTRWGAR